MVAVSHLVVGAALGTAVEVLQAAAPIGTEVALGADEGSGVRDHRPDPLVKLMRRYRLGQVLGGAGVPGHDHIVFLGVTTDHDDGYERVRAGAVGAHLADEIEPTAGLHFEIAKDDIDGLGAQQPERLVAVRRQADGADAEGPEQGLDDVAHVHVVIDDQHMEAIERTLGHVSSVCWRRPAVLGQRSPLRRPPSTVVPPRLGALDASSKAVGIILSLSPLTTGEPVLRGRAARLGEQPFVGRLSGPGPKGQPRPLQGPRAAPRGRVEGVRNGRGPGRGLLIWR